MQERSIFERIWAAIKTTVAGPMSKEKVHRALNEAQAARLAHGERLDWEHSVVDLMKLLNLDSSREARKELAVELGYPGPIDYSAEMNTGLHKHVMEQVAKRCLEVPKE